MKFGASEKRFGGPPKSANGGYVCGLLAAYIEGNAEITLLAPPPLGEPLCIIAGERSVELRTQEKTLARGRKVSIDLPEIPVASFCEAHDAIRRLPYDESRHPLPTCFVCGPRRTEGDGLRIIPSPLPARADDTTFAAAWVPAS